MVLINLNNQDMEIKYTVNEICLIEEKTGKGIMALLSQENIGFNTIRLLLWGGLRHKQQHLTPELSGDLIQSYINSGKSLIDMMDKITKSLKESGLLGSEEDTKNTEEVGKINPV